VLYVNDGDARSSEKSKKGVHLSGSAIETLRDLPVDGFLITNAIVQANLDARWQVVDISPLIDQAVHQLSAILFDDDYLRRAS
jgi:hypothetical protein